MQFGANFHAGSKSDAASRIKGLASCPHAVQEPAIIAVNMLDGEPTNIKIAIAGAWNGKGPDGRERIKTLRIDVQVG